MPSPGFLVVINKPVKDDTESDAFVFEVKEAHKTRRIFLEGGGVKALSHEHYLLKGDSRPARTCMDLYELDDIDPLLDGKILLEEGGDQAGPVRESHSYVYKHVSTHGSPASGSSTDRPGMIVLTAMDPPMTVLDDFNRWYEEEHTPMLSKVPGWQSTYRGKLLLLSNKAEQDTCKHAAFHRYARENGSDTSQEWKAATSTEWGNRIRDAIAKDGRKSRSVWEYQETHA